MKRSFKNVEMGYCDEVGGLCLQDVERYTGHLAWFVPEIPPIRYDR